MNSFTTPVPSPSHQEVETHATSTAFSFNSALHSISETEESVENYVDPVPVDLRCDELLKGVAKKDFLKQSYARYSYKAPSAKQLKVVAAAREKLGTCDRDVLSLAVRARKRGLEVTQATAVSPSTTVDDWCRVTELFPDPAWQATWTEAHSVPDRVSLDDKDRVTP